MALFLGTFTTAALVVSTAALPWPQQVARRDAEISWQPCENIEPYPPGLDCGALSVPLDWDDQDGGSITLMMARFRSNSTDKLGNLIFNPGGPGGAASQVCLYQAMGVPAFSEALVRSYDIICPDPRGVGYSNPVSCDTTVANSDTSLWPDSLEQFQALIEKNKALGESCLELTGELVKHVDTVSAAKDLEALRKALQDEKLNFLGESYGSQLGSQYAELFPEQVGRMALDGATDHSVGMWELVNIETASYDDTLHQFFNWCQANGADCGWESKDFEDDYRQLIAAANASPIPAPGCEAGSESGSLQICKTSVTGHDIQVVVQDMLLHQFPQYGILKGWDSLGAALQETIHKQNATAFAQKFVSETENNFGGTAVQCLDWPTWEVMTPEQVDAAWADLQEYQKFAKNAFPLTNGASQAYTIQMTCAGWPVGMTNPPHVLDKAALSGAPSILIVNSLHDPSTPMPWAVRLHEQIPDSVLLTRNGSGHTSYFLHGEAAQAMDQFFIEGVMPEEGTVVPT